MTDKLRLGPLPKVETVRLTIMLPVKVKSDLDHYVALYASTYHEAVDPASLVPHMLASFMDRDRTFRKALASQGPSRDVTKTDPSRIGTDPEAHDSSD